VIADSLPLESNRDDQRFMHDLPWNCKTVVGLTTLPARHTTSDVVIESSKFELVTSDTAAASREAQNILHVGDRFLRLRVWECESA
jgi:hypothetical protein